MLKTFASSILFTAIFFQTWSAYSYELNPPPAHGSIQEKADYATLHQYQQTRTASDCAVANAQSNPSFENLFGPQTGVLTAQEIAAFSTQAKNLIHEAITEAGVFKLKYHRYRPYIVDKTLKPCVPLPGTRDSYPSGHATIGIVLAEALVTVYPAKREAILKQGEQIGLNRVIGGVHHPSDIEAGRILGHEIASNLIQKLK